MLIGCNDRYYMTSLKFSKYKCGHHVWVDFWTKTIYQEAETKSSNGEGQLREDSLDETTN